MMEMNVYGSDEFYSIFLPNLSEKTLNLGKPQQTTKQTGVIGLAVVYGILFVAGLATNIRVVCVITSVLSSRNNNANKKERQKNVLVYILALCCCNIVVLFFVSFLLSDLWVGYWIVQSTLVCKLYLLSESLNKFSSPFLLAALSGTCYINICRRAKYRELLTYTIIIVLCVVFVIILTAPVIIFGDVIYLVLRNGTEYQYYLNKCMFNPPEHLFDVYIIYSFLFGYVAPALLFCCFYGAILLFIHRHARLAVIGKALCFWRVAKTALGLVLFYLLCWTPYWAMTLYHYINPYPSSGSNVLIYIGYAVHMLPYINCTGYPILYTVLNQDIKNAYRRVQQRRQRDITANRMDSRRTSVFDELLSRV